MGDTALENVSVPLSGVISINKYQVYMQYLDQISFRPLIGVNFCKRADRSIRRAVHETIVSVPLSG